MRTHLTTSCGSPRTTITPTVSSHDTASITENRDAAFIHARQYSEFTFLCGISA